MASSAKLLPSKLFLSPTSKKQSNSLQVDLFSKLASNGKLTNNKHKKYFKKQSVPLLQCKRLQVGLLFQEADYGHSQKLHCFSNCWSSSSCFWEILEKIESNFQNSRQTESYVELLYVAMSSIWLNISTLSDPHSLFISLTSSLILG